MMTLPLEKQTALFVALSGLWLLACLGVFVVAAVGDWAFIFSDDRSLVTAQIDGFYLAFYGAQIPAIAFVALVVCNSKFNHPILTSAFVTTSFQLAMFAIQFGRQSGASSFGQDRWVAINFHLARIIASSITVMFLAWIIGNPKKAK